MSAIKTTEIAGDLSVTRNITGGSNATVRGNATVGHNLTVGGWLDAENIKGVNKGLYESKERLNAAYPLPRPGWYAFVGDTLPAEIYIEQDGKWKGTGNSGGEHTIDCDQYNDEVARLLEDYGDVSGQLVEFDKDIHGKASTYKVAFRFMNDGQSYEGFAEFQAALDEMYNSGETQTQWLGRWLALVNGINYEVHNYLLSSRYEQWVQTVSGGITSNTCEGLERCAEYKVLYRTHHIDSGWGVWHDKISELKEELDGKINELKEELDDKLSKNSSTTEVVNSTVAFRGAVGFSGKRVNVAEYKGTDAVGTFIVDRLSTFAKAVSFTGGAEFNKATRGTGMIEQPAGREFITKEYADRWYLERSAYDTLVKATENGVAVDMTDYAKIKDFVVFDVTEAVEYNGRVYTGNEQGLSLDDFTTDDNLIIVTNQGKICKRYTKASSGTGSGWGSSSTLYVSVAGEINNRALYRTPDGAMYVYDILTFTFVPIGSNAKGYKVETENNLLVVEDEDGGEWVCGVTKRVAPATPTIAQTTRDVEVGGETVNAVFTITCATAGAETYYSAGKDSDPTKTGTKASKVEIAMSPNNDDKVSQTVRLASKLNGAWSAVSDSIDLVANFKVCQPKVFVLGTKYDDNRDVEIKCATQGASVKYTYGMNIDVPYTIGDKINFTDEVSVTAKATKTNYKDSELSNEGVVTLNYPKTYIGDFNGTSITLDEIRALSKPLESDGLKVEKSYSFSNNSGGYIWICQTTPLDKDNLFYSAVDIIPIGFASAKEVDVETGSGTIKYYCYRSLEKQNAGVTTIYLKS